MNRPITATIITLNEENHIRAVIDSCMRVCDEVIVVDSESTDDTVRLAEEAGAKVIVQAYLGDGPQKNHGAPFAKNDWILSIDADERLEDSAVDAILGLDLDNPIADSFSFRRKSYVGDRWIKLWYPDYVTRLYDRSKCAYQDAIGHASVVGGTVKKLPCDLVHYSFDDYGDLIGRNKKFIVRGARQVLERGESVGALTPLFHGIGSFTKHYFLRGGFLYGGDGLNISINSAFSSFMKYVVARESVQRSQKGTD